MPMATHIATHSSGDRLFFDRRTRDGYARGHIKTDDGVRIEVENLASLIYRGFGWKLTRAGVRTKLMPGENTE